MIFDPKISASHQFWITPMGDITCQPTPKVHKQKVSFGQYLYKITHFGCIKVIHSRK